MNATAPIIGGVNCPPLEAAASTAPAKEFLKPCLFIIGMVKTPVPTTLATGLPEIVPNIALATMAECAVPPLILDVAAVAILRRIAVAPVASKTAPKTIKTKTIEETISVGRPKTPEKLYQTVWITSSKEKPL